jgi:hypothetical protein
MSQRNVALALVLLFIGAANATAAEPGWSPVVVARGEYRQQIKSTPIEQRPYRPLHVYGNTVRRQHYRGTAMPIPKGLAPSRRSSF